MDTTKITSAPAECQFHNNCGGWCESPREADHNLCADCLEAHDDDLSKGNVDSSKAVLEPAPLDIPAQQRQAEPIWYMIESGLSVMHAKAKAESEQNGWDTSAYSIPLHTHADPAEVERLRAGIRKHWRVVCNQRERIIVLRKELTELRRWEATVRENSLLLLDLERGRAQLAETHALLREVSESGFMVDGQIMPSNEALELQDRVESALSASAEPIAPAEIDERAEFERRFPNYDHTLCSHEDWKDQYEDPKLGDMWNGWQARATLERKV